MPNKASGPVAINLHRSQPGALVGKRVKMKFLCYPIKVPLWLLGVISIALLALLIALKNKNTLEFNAVRCENITFFGSPKSKDLEGNYTEYFNGKRVWHKINNEMWIELYPDSKDNIFHIYKRLHYQKINDCEGDILERVNIRIIPAYDRMFSYEVPAVSNSQIFMPRNVKKSPLLSGQEKN